MGWKINSFLVAVAGVIFYARLAQDPVVPDVPDRLWGNGKSKEIRPFKIDVPTEVLKDLRARLSLPPRLVEPMDGMAFQYGFNHKQIEKIRQYWLSKYDWTAKQAELNKLRHFKTNVAGLDLHFIHELPKKTAKSSVPLLLMHGWPGSVVEFLQIIPILTDPTKLSAAMGKKVDFAFEVIAPSLPGYGFSEATKKPGLSAPDIAPIMRQLMERLGFQKFFVQGGDWGSLVATSMAIIYPQQVRGVHVNMAFSNGLKSNLKYWLGGLTSPAFVVGEEFVPLMYPLKEKYSFILRETGYMHLQATKPDTVGVALNSSPLGLAAYILEKFITWTNGENILVEDGKLTEKFQMDDLLTNVMVYWVTNSITSSMRLYKESFQGFNFAYDMDTLPVKIPTGVAIFPKELMVQPRSILEDRFQNITRLTLMERGGHFGAFEEPTILAREIGLFVINLL